MTENKLYNILDLIEEINKVDEMIELHSSSNSELMLSQYTNQKLKLSKYLFKELLSNKDSKPEAMYIIKIFIEKFYNDEIKISRVNKDESLKRIKNVFTENYS